MSRPPDDHGLGGLLPGRISVAFAALMHAAVGGFVVASGQILPTLATVLLIGLWLAVGVTIWRWRHDRPLVVLLLPFIAPVALWAALRWLGEA